MYCNHCGAEIPNQANFCTHCGAKTTTNIYQEQNRTSRSNVEGLPVASVVCGFIGLCTSVFFVGKLFIIAGLVTGIISLAKKMKPKVLAIIGIVLSGIGILGAIVFSMLLWNVFGIITRSIFY